MTRALKPTSNEVADREVRGVKIECTAFRRKGGGGSITIYRRFGIDPVRAIPPAEAMIAEDRASHELKIENEQKAANSRQFLDWYQDTTVPKDVKVFVMMVARVIALEQKCPTSKSHTDKFAKWASDIGVQPSDFVADGRYAPLMATISSQFVAGSKDESTAEACEAIKSYD
ncbi:hypothetical protein [Bradyrhizobium sp. CB3481]|uniref:hypothetical protein n=1 Tax=Bradyrhizobium sp. CB3481 TaxID=3039158 RepID=UPI0024B122A4|nr:hypothetical protein [Bradyrhizobium sp. CB3481]WFU14411.1 hypothetical protein QA643_24855 [Bradyrhizobium sp. CB3481]